MLPVSARALLAALLIATLSLVATAGSPARGAGALPCSTAGTWAQGEVNVYWLDVEQGDSQLIVGPTGKTLLIDLGETAFNTTGAGTNATRVASKIRQVCGTGTSPVALDYVMTSHHHLDHIGYAANPDDTPGTYGNGLYQLLTPGGLGFTVGTLLDHDGGSWTDANGDGKCNVGTSTAPAPEIAWHNAGTVSQTSRRWICWLYGPAAQADRATPLTFTVGAARPSPDRPGAVEVDLSATHRPSLDAIRGLVPARSTSVWLVRPEGDTWRVSADPLTFRPVLPAEAGATDVVQRWVSLLAACNAPDAAGLQVAANLYGPSSLVQAPCATHGAWTAGPPTGLDRTPDPRAFLAAFGPEVATWARLVPVQGQGSRFLAAVAPMGDGWQVMGVAVDGP